MKPLEMITLTEVAKNSAPWWKACSNGWVNGILTNENEHPHSAMLPGHHYRQEKKDRTLVSSHPKGFGRSVVVYFGNKTRTLRGQKGVVDAGDLDSWLWWRPICSLVFEKIETHCWQSREWWKRRRWNNSKNSKNNNKLQPLKYQL